MEDYTEEITTEETTEVVTEETTEETSEEVSESIGTASEESRGESSEESVSASDLTEGSSAAVPVIERIIEKTVYIQAETETTTAISYSDDLQFINDNLDMSIQGIFIMLSVVVLACFGLFKHWGT